MASSVIRCWNEKLSNCLEKVATDVYTIKVAYFKTAAKIDNHLGNFLRPMEMDKVWLLLEMAKILPFSRSKQFCQS